MSAAVTHSPIVAKVFQNATRTNTSLTASTEKRVLLWLAARTPQAVGSDHLTALALLAQIAAGLCFALSAWQHWLLLAVIPCLALNWLGDSLDGTLARHRHQERTRYGFYVDHIVDLIGGLALMGGLALSPLAHSTISLLMLLAFFLLAAESYLATYTLGRFELAHAFFGPTEIRILLAIGTFAAWRNPHAHILGHTFLLFDLGGVIGSACMLVMAFQLAAKHTHQLYKEEPLA
ncbi:MAG: CDP-alcohol phosphatidyltransferase family protein [Acidobacteriaceae bacterium]|nr:CDP-alcohol phosphatidyltransferase family protein [Acidobacteriaceae bacterium]